MISLTTVIVALVIIVIVISYFFWRTGDHSDYRNYLGIVSSIGIVIVFSTFIFNYFESNKAKELAFANSFIQTTVTGWDDIEEMFLKYYPYLERLYYQMYPSVPGIKVPEVKDETERLKQEHHACHIIIRSIQIVFDANGGLSTDWNTEQESWLYSFQQWLSSPILRQYWDQYQVYYPPDMQKFINDIVIPGTAS